LGDASKALAIFEGDPFRLIRPAADG
jgi:hypothetical protein